jgi:[protein-PII] uridylyltransferase
MTPEGDIKSFLLEEETLIRSAHFCGAGGGEVVQRRTALIDRTLKAIYHSLAETGSLPVLIAVGGYGRGELNPFSDIDILFLCRDEQQREQAPRMLYALWDAGLDIAYSVRTIDECIELSRNDTKIRSSLLESRLLAGDPAQYQVYQQQMQAEVFYRKPQSYITEKIAERNATRLKYGGSLYLREPNIKESAGGLRDFHSAGWLAFTRFRVSSFPGLVTQGIITSGQLTTFLRARNFLWHIRNEIHYLSGRKNDQLTFDMQDAAARDFHFRDSAHLLAVERFMKLYFLHASIIQEFSRLVTERVLPVQKRSWFDRAQVIGPFTLAGKTLSPGAEDIVTVRPELFMQAFELYQSRHAAFSDRLKHLIITSRFGDEVRTSKDAARTFLSILDNPDRLFDTLGLMKDLKYLGRYLPEFRAIQALARRDYYHTYTVDEHILMAVRGLEDVWQGRYPGLSSLYEAFKKLGRRWVLMLAVLLHDLGKACLTDHEHRGREIAEGILDRLGIADGDRRRILFLIENHLLMATLSQRRELSDQKVITEFARTVQDVENLNMLYLLTYADLSAVSPTAWSQWKAALLQDLYLRTLSVLEQTGGTEQKKRQLAAAHVLSLQEAARGSFEPEEIRSFIDAMPVHYLDATSVRKQLYHLEMFRHLMKEKLVIRYRHRHDKGYTELTICAYDAYGMFYRTAGTIAAKNLNVLRAQVYTGRNGVMIDTFQITDADGKLIDYDEVWKTITADLRDVLSGERIPPEPRPSQFLRAVTATVPASVEFDNAASDALTIIDIVAKDRVGLLYRITKCLYDLNLDIASAKIVTEGVRVMDSFYVSDLFRMKITDPERIAKIKDALLKVLE